MNEASNEASKHIAKAREIINEFLAQDEHPMYMLLDANVLLEKALNVLCGTL